MAPGYSISSIGYPSMGLGDWGLGTSGSYGNYDNYMPSMMGIGGYGNMGMMGMGMYNPMFMANMQQGIEASQLNHAANMHTGMKNYEVQAYRETDSALIRKILSNATVKQGLATLRYKVINGSQDGICQEFDKLRNYILNTYRDEIKERGDKENPMIAATGIIDDIYASTYSTSTEPVTLRGDIERYGEGAMMSGFMSTFKPGHDKRYTAETLNHVYGMNISEHEAQESERGIGAVGGRAAHSVKTGVIAGSGAAAATVGLAALAKGISLGKIPFKPIAKHCGKIGLLAGCAALIADLIKPGIVGDLIWSRT